MKIKLTLFSCIIAVVILSGQAFSDSMDELSEEFAKSYESLKPRPNSSVNSDYKLDQLALGSLYTNKSLNLIYKQNREMSEKYDSLITKYDQVITQNREIIRLLSIIAKRSDRAMDY